MIVCSLLGFLPLGVLLLRLMVAVDFVDSGWSNLRFAGDRATSIGQSDAFTIFRGVPEIAGCLGIVFGALTQLPAFGLILVRFGAVYKEIAVCTLDFRATKPMAGTRIWFSSL